MKISEKKNQVLHHYFSIFFFFFNFIYSFPVKIWPILFQHRNILLVENWLKDLLPFILFFSCFCLHHFSFEFEFDVDIYFRFPFFFSFFYITNIILFLLTAKKKLIYYVLTNAFLFLLFSFLFNVSVVCASVSLNSSYENNFLWD